MRLLPNGQINIEDLFTGATLVVESSRLVQALFDSDLQFTVVGKQAKRTQNSNDAEQEYLDLSDCPETLVAIARYRLEVIRPLLTADLGFYPVGWLL